MFKVFVSFLSLSLILNAQAAQASESTQFLPFGELQSFKTDYCTKFPDGGFQDPIQWQDCCVQHDLQYWAGGTYQERQWADWQLYQCVKSTGAEKIARLMYEGVRIGGSPYLNTPWRWGFGWSRPRGYAALNHHELAEIDRHLHHHQK